MTAIHTATLDVLRHLRLHGRQTTKQILTAVPKAQARTVHNLRHQGYVDSLPLERGHVAYTITTKGQRRVAQANAADATANAAAGQAALLQTARNGQGSALASHRDTDAAILATLGRASGPLSVTDIARRTHLPEALVRPAITMLVQAGQVLTRTTRKVPMYRLPVDGRAIGHGRVPLPTGTYDGAELRRNPGIGAERFAAFALPSRVNDRLHWPDGRVTPFKAPRG